MSLNIRVFNNSDVARLPIKKVISVISNVFKGEGIDTANVNLIYINSTDMAELNEKYLSHEGDTDVITFPLEDDTIDGEVYICPQVAKEQSFEYKVSMENEILRLSAHGALHLCGYNDSTADNRQLMSDLETKYINI